MCVFHDLHAAMLLNVHNPPAQFLVVARIIWSPRFFWFPLLKSRKKSSVRRSGKELLIRLL